MASHAVGLFKRHFAFASDNFVIKTVMHGRVDAGEEKNEARDYSRTPETMERKKANLK